MQVRKNSRPLPLSSPSLNFSFSLPPTPLFYLLSLPLFLQSTSLDLARLKLSPPVDIRKEGRTKELSLSLSLSLSLPTSKKSDSGGMFATWNAFMFGKNSRALRLGAWFANWVPCLIQGKQHSW